ncbi:uncharacterized protein BKA55DRAFT_582678 [Fusarium redolens]|uniref:C2H2-type domain-containing protein n=1 Tax=Fusarium redolens TaxID=48865 RepID=A0A9P9G378_FUSRE|nr:uncharacterized protein BKA55DRAFT_582678 [Fusarium redolens]KAH7231398.1 hypothetical protein BKA55DRAFT_582678 [Fusarium redolens]
MSLMVTSKLPLTPTLCLSSTRLAPAKRHTIMTTRLFHLAVGSGGLYATNLPPSGPEALISCRLCGHMAPDRDLKRHYQSHLPKKYRERYKCSECSGKDSARPDLLQRHQTSVHRRLTKSSANK